MERYRNISGNSNISAYEIGSDYIAVKFQNTARIYRYSYAKAGRANVEHMKQLALAGHGLNSFIRRVVNKLYD